jgi:hypothetical protein
MKSVRKWWLPLLLGALLTALLMGAAAATPTQQPQAAKATKKLTISMAEFEPVYDSAYIPSPHYNTGGWLVPQLDAPLDFVAPVQFPYAGVVTLEKIELIGHDANSTHGAHLYLYRTNPKDWSGTRRKIGSIHSGDSWAGGDYVMTDSSISPKHVTPGHQAWLQLILEDDTDLWVCGVAIYYHKGK